MSYRFLTICIENFFKKFLIEFRYVNGTLSTDVSGREWGKWYLKKMIAKMDKTIVAVIKSLNQSFDCADHLMGHAAGNFSPCRLYAYAQSCLITLKVCVTIKNLL